MNILDWLFQWRGLDSAPRNGAPVVLRSVGGSRMFRAQWNMLKAHNPADGR